MELATGMPQPLNTPILQPRPGGGPAWLPKSQSLKSVPEFVFLHKRFSAWATAAASLLLLYLYHLNGSFTFEYLNLCQSLANIWEGNKAGSQCSEIDKMNKNVEGKLLHSAYKTGTSYPLVFPPFILPYLCTYKLIRLEIEFIKSTFLTRQRQTLVKLPAFRSLVSWLLMRQLLQRELVQRLTQSLRSKL